MQKEKELVKSKLFKNLMQLSKIPSDIHNHLMWLYVLTVSKNSKVIVELGVRTGSSTQAFLAACAAIPDAKLYSYDIQKLKAPKWSRKYALLNRIPEAVEYDFWEFEIKNSLEVYKQWEDESIDILFIDDKHRFKHVYKELKLLHKKVKKDGYILLHDINMDGSDPKVNGIVRAIHKFIDEHPNYTYVNCLCHNGLGLLFQS